MRRDPFDGLTKVADDLRDAKKIWKQQQAQLAEDRLIMAMALDIIRKGEFHPNMQQQVAGVTQKLRRAVSECQSS